MNTLQISDAFEPYYVGRKGILSPTRVSDDEARRKAEKRAQEEKRAAETTPADKPS